jgi:hypothetical protein
MHAKLERPKALEISLTRQSAFNLCADTTTTLRSFPDTDLNPANMEGEKYQPSLIRLWRVWRTTKEMMNDRVGCACA